ncbi:MAG: peptidylprolyl isomerase [Candidatus Nanohalarchaeota archaeon]|nr:MAG: peptidylprolyl isomerase [Candidatus Nanohaloarchaeota archaeon]
MENKTFIEIEYIGRIAETKEVFDLTDEKTAKENNIYNPNTRYGPTTIIIGENMILKSLEDRLKKMKPKETKKITLTPQEAFGKREPKLLKIYSLAFFRKQKITPILGQYITLGDNIQGKVLSVSAGRVKIDFNHQLSGKTLEYEITLNKIITGQKEKITSLLERTLGFNKKDIQVTSTKEKTTITLPTPKELPKEAKSKIAEIIKKHIKDLKEIEILNKTPEVANTKK